MAALASAQKGQAPKTQKLSLAVFLFLHRDHAQGGGCSQCSQKCDVHRGVGVNCVVLRGVQGMKLWCRTWVGSARVLL